MKHGPKELMPLPPHPSPPGTPGTCQRTGQEVPDVSPPRGHNAIVRWCCGDGQLPRHLPHRKLGCPSTATFPSPVDGQLHSSEKIQDPRVIREIIANVRFNQSPHALPSGFREVKQSHRARSGLQVWPLSPNWVLLLWHQKLQKLSARDQEISSSDQSTKKTQLQDYDRWVSQHGHLQTNTAPHHLT